MKGLNYTIAAKPTRYKGVQFRSRLEATWAAAFDIEKWRWEYESKRFATVACQMRYLPDFLLWIADYSYIIEVRPHCLWVASRKKLNALGAQVIILVGEEGSHEPTNLYDDNGLEVGHELGDVNWSAAERRIRKNNGLQRKREGV